MKLVLASKNKKKLAELNDILSQLGIQVCSEAEAGVDVEVEETGTTFEENSLLKAKAVMEASGLPAVADDSGLCVDCLGGAPGVYSARYGGEGLDDTGRYKLLL
ncbi:MAG: non-canonical purine NTP pyrophosphatase, partial [Lawsonibacter sp.]|nr:non-canonical purine NTP pyrophosphatase [Lawsonibacter sp.]